jgi:hypothetical protein
VPRAHVREAEHEAHGRAPGGRGRRGPAGYRRTAARYRPGLQSKAASDREQAGAMEVTFYVWADRILSDDQRRNAFWQKRKGSRRWQWNICIRICWE